MTVTETAALASPARSTGGSVVGHVVNATLRLRAGEQPRTGGMPSEVEALVVELASVSNDHAHSQSE